MLVPQCEGSRIALFVETSNAESPTLMYMYSDDTMTVDADNRPSWLYAIHPRDVPVALFFDEQKRVCEILTLPKSKRTVRLL